ncbi:MAG: radical SAM protein [Candidatus Aenigmarchaeota archaeon]|nr:radical SAM protein [Candidatus Aenigmarchaeota archaeon]
MFENFIIPPIGLSYVAASLKKEGIDVEILDANALQMTWEQLEKELESRGKVDVIGVTGMTPTIDRTYRTAQIARKHCKHLILGGPHGTICTDQTFDDCPEVDIIVLHEGEVTAPILIKKLENGEDIDDVRGIAFRKDGKIVKTERRDLIQDLDSISQPARELLPMDKYRYPIGKHKKISVIITSRGCPYKCIFCNKTMFGQMWRARSAKNVVDEIENVYRTYGIKSFIFYDDLFVTDKNRAIEICQGIIDRKLNIEWKCECRVNLVDKELLTKMREAGCILISYGVESANQKSLDFLNKGITVEQIRTAFKLSKEVGIEKMAYLIIGIPGESKEDAMRTITFAEEIDADYVQISILTPMKNTPLFDVANEKGWIVSKYAKNPYDQELTERHVLATGDIPEEDLEKLMKDAHRKFLLTPKYLFKTVKRVRSLNQIKNVMITGTQYLKWLKSKN